MSPFANPAEKRAYQRGWAAGRRKMFFEDKACERCGVTSPLVLHHKDRSKKTSHSIWSWGHDRRTAEITKCEILCEPCHHDEHRELFQTAPADKALVEYPRRNSNPRLRRERAMSWATRRRGPDSCSSPKVGFPDNHAGLRESCLEPVFKEDADA